MRKGEKRNEWTTSELAYLQANAGHLPVAEIARELKRSRSSIKAMASRLGVSLRHYESSLAWCDFCATMRSELDEEGRCPVCKLNEQLVRAEWRVAEALHDLPAESRDLYANTESLRSSEAVRVERPSMAGLTLYKQRKADERYRLAVESAECAYLQRQVNSTKTRLKRIREKAGTNPRKKRNDLH